MPAQRKRRIYFVDKKVQGALILRAIRYWMISIAVVGSLTLLGWMLITPGIGALIRLRDELPWLLDGLCVGLGMSLVVLPVILYDLMKMSNRFVGPMFRLHTALKQAAAGERVKPIHFRDNDYWQDVAQAFNQLNARLESFENKETQPETELSAAEF
jgi:hypothetical protein